MENGDQLNELALFAGAGGGILGGKLLGWRTICAVEWESYPASVLIARQNEGILPAFPIWDDVCTFDGKPWRGCVDVVSGGFPCQDISSAGKGAGIDGARSGMWAHMARIIHEVGPRYVFVENSPMLTKRGLHRVLGDVASLGYDAEWGVLGAHHAGAPHKRDRIWILAKLADTAQLQRNGRNDNTGIRLECEATPKLGDDSGAQDVANPNVSQLKGGGIPSGVHAKHANPNQSSSWWETDPADVAQSGMGRVADVVAARVDKLKAIGNGQVPAVAALAWKILKKRIDSRTSI